MQYLLLAHLGAANLVVDRLCRLSETDSTSARIAGNAAITMAHAELAASLDFAETLDTLNMDDNARFLYENAQQSMHLATARINDSDQHASPQPSPTLTDEASTCLNIVADAARLDYHANQLRTTPNQNAMVLHSQSADALINDIQYYAESILDADGNPIQPGDDTKHLYNAAGKALQDAITGYTRMIGARRQRATLTKSNTISKMPGQDQIDQLMEEFRNSEQPVMITTARLQPTELGQPSSVMPLIVFDSGLNIHCKAIAEQYPPETPAELVQQHVGVCSQFISNGIAQGFLQVHEAQTIQRHALAIYQAAQAELHNTPLDSIQAFVDKLVDQGISPTSIHEMIVAMAHSQNELVNYLLSTLSIPPATTPQQAQIIMATAQAQGLHPATMQAVAAALDVTPEVYDISAVPYGLDDLNNIMVAGQSSALPRMAIYQAAASLGFDADYLAQASNNFDQQPETPTPQPFQSPLIVPSHNLLA